MWEFSERVFFVPFMLIISSLLFIVFIFGCTLIHGFKPRSHRSHGWFRLSLAERRDFGLISSKHLTRSLAYSLTQFHSFCYIEYFPYLILIKTYVAFFPVNGIYPLSRMYKITPIDHKSHFVPYFNELFITYGAT